MLGGRGAYFQHGGFSVQEYVSTGKTIDGYKVIRHKTKDQASLPQMSNTPGTVYILENSKGYKSIGIYGDDRRLRKEIDLRHGHTNRPASGKIERLRRGVAHVHNIRGGRGNNVRYMTKKEIKKYGALVIKLGGAVR